MCLQNGESVRYEELTIEGRNAVIEAFRAGKTIDKVFILDGCMMARLIQLQEKREIIIQLSVMW